MNEHVIEERLEEAYRDDLEDGMVSQAIAYACEEHPEIILEILKEDDPDMILDIVASLKSKVYKTFKEQNYDSVSRTLGDE